MTPSARQAIACVLFIFLAAVCSQSQVAPAKSSTATISGKVTLKTKELAGIVVAARQFNSSYSNSSGVILSRLRATTDQTGKYRITNVPPGTYHVSPFAPGLVLENELFEKPVVIGAGENVDDVNFSMVRGGVVTGKITDADSRPMVEEQIFVQPVDGPYAETPYYLSGISTDDRGVYRAFGLRAGKYRVYVGQSDNRMPGGPRLYKQTFYPSVTDAAKATVIEVTEGGETNDIDIMMGRPFTAFKVTGKIVDSETGKPVPNAPYGISEVTSDGSGQSTSGAISNANGEFKYEGVMPGKYAIYIAPDQDTDVRAEPVSFEVVDHDVTGLVIKTVKALSISGVVVMEGSEDPAAIRKLGNIYVQAISERTEAPFHGGSSAVAAPDGSFKVSGLSPGVVYFGIGGYNLGGGSKRIRLARVERDGILQPRGVNIKEGEQITGLRLIVKTLAATIRGQVKLEDGELPANARLSIWVQLANESRSPGEVMYMDSNQQIDSRGKFLIEGLAGGNYEISVGLFEPGRSDTTRIFKQQVTVADDSVSDVTVTIKLKP